MALENLAKILDPEQNPNMYKRLIDDYASTNHAFNVWWKTQKDKYEWFIERLAFHPQYFRK